MSYQRCSLAHAALLALVVFAIGPNPNGIAQAQNPSATPKPPATPTPKPPPAPSDPDTGPTGPQPGGPELKLAGTWRLDKSLSQGLIARLQGADEVTWTITQEGQTISISQKVLGGQSPAGAGGGGGMADYGRDPTSSPPTYTVNGREAVTDVPFGQSMGKLTTKATMIGNTLELMRKTTFLTPDGTERVSTTTQQLSLSDGGKTLTAKIHTESSRGPLPDSTLVFKKQ